MYTFKSAINNVKRNKIERPSIIATFEFNSMINIVKNQITSATTAINVSPCVNSLAPWYPRDHGKFRSVASLNYL